MKPLIKIMLILMAIFATTFVIIKSTGVLTIEQIELWLEQAKELSPLYVGAIVAALLFVDLFIAVPTLTLIILSGYFLGHGYGFTASITGLMLAGITGYGLSHYFRDGILKFLVKDEEQQQEAQASFKKNGFLMILLSRGMPILPEVTACLSGMTRMPFAKFLFAWSCSAVPYAYLASYAGSISSLENPKPAIFTAIGISSFLWLVYYLLKHRKILA